MRKLFPFLMSALLAAPLWAQQSAAPSSDGAAGASAGQASVGVRTLSVGDANGDGALSVFDINALSQHILGQTPAVFYRLLADVNADGEISVFDIVRLADLILHPAEGKTFLVVAPSDDVSSEPQL